MGVVLIAGPTASGKSSLALEMALESDGVVINADSMQVYDTLHILTARPSQADMELVDHRLYGHVPASQAYSVGKWYRDVETLLSAPEMDGRAAVFVGGTGLYFRALTGGLSQMPAIPDAVRQRWREALDRDGVESLHARLAEWDPETAAQLKTGDRQRILRALEVLDASGQSIRSHQDAEGQPLIDAERAQKILFMPDRDLLRERITTRFGQMMDSGAAGEVERLLALRLDPNLPAMKAIGVREIGAYIRGEITAAKAIELASIATRQYAKRQMTWFRNQLEPDWEIRSGTKPATASEPGSD
jgi:tRNA dimethylallyltransferase